MRQLCLQKELNTDIIRYLVNYLFASLYYYVNNKLYKAQKTNRKHGAIQWHKKINSSSYFK